MARVETSTTSSESKLEVGSLYEVATAGPNSVFRPGVILLCAAIPSEDNHRLVELSSGLVYTAFQFDRGIITLRRLPPGQRVCVHNE